MDQRQCAFALNLASLSSKLVSALGTYERGIDHIFSSNLMNMDRVRYYVCDICHESTWMKNLTLQRETFESIIIEHTQMPNLS